MQRKEGSPESHRRMIAGTIVDRMLGFPAYLHSSKKSGQHTRQQ
jgi:hypothetical protein